MKLQDILESNVVRFPSEKRGYQEDPVTGLWNRIPDKTEPEFWVVSGPDWGGKAYSTHKTHKEADTALKKLKLKGNKEKDLRVKEI